MKTEWWQPRRHELLAMAGRGSPLYVFNEETLNEIFFDLLSMDAIDRLFYPVHANAHPKILRKAFELGLGFLCVFDEELDGLLRDFSQLDPRQVLFFPPADRGPDVARALDKGVYVGVNDLRAVDRRSDIFQNRQVFIRADGGMDDILSLLTETPVHDPKGFTLIIGNGMRSGVHPEAEFMDIPRFGDALGTLKEACPQLNLWLEVPVAMLACSGVLMTRVVETGEETRVRCIRVDGDMNIPACHGRIGPSRPIVNLSRPDNEETTSVTRIIGRTGGPENWIDVSPSPAAVAEGDILLFTHMGAHGSKTDSAGRRQNDTVTQYLRARSMCPVTIYRESRRAP